MKDADMHACARVVTTRQNPSSELASVRRVFLDILARVKISPSVNSDYGLSVDLSYPSRVHFLSEPVGEPFTEVLYCIEKSDLDAVIDELLKHAQRGEA